MLKKILLGLVVIFVLIQFYRPEKNQSEFVASSDMLEIVAAPIETKEIVKSTCYDCHSNHTEGYLWYAEIAPVSWWLSSHVNEGKEHLNFSEWLQYDQKKKNHKLEECVETLEEGEMPLKSYTWTHPKANLSGEEKQKLIEWFNSQKK